MLGTVTPEVTCGPHKNHVVSMGIRTANSLLELTPDVGDDNVGNVQAADILRRRNEPNVPWVLVKASGDIGNVELPGFKV